VSLSKPIKLIVAAATAWPIVYMFLFFIFVFGSVFWAAHSPAGDKGHAAGPPVAFLVLMAAHLGTILETFGLLAFYVTFLFKTERVPQDKKALWAAVLFLGNMVAMPVFFYLYVWPDEWPRKTTG
jgi:hypothetical protein